MDSKGQKNNSNGGGSEFSMQPNNGNGVAAEIAAHKATPGIAIAQNMPAQEGSREDRRARKEALNK
ncbi:hypothetical protein E4U55_001896 [Claviceps digitariae]|nr:hypothetical protein E4U55_001896 [Claviceps digitariae]